MNYKQAKEHDMYEIINDITKEIMFEFESEEKAYSKSVELGCKGYSVHLELAE